MGCQGSTAPKHCKKIVKDGNSFVILTTENMTFFSRKQSRELLDSEDFFDSYIQELRSSLNNLVIISKSIVTIDNYLALQLEIRATVEQSGVNMSVGMESYLILYEDKIVSLQGMGPDTVEFKALKKLYKLMMLSVVFPDQYN